LSGGILMSGTFPWEALCARARARAAELGGPVVASAVLPADNLAGDGGEPLALLEAGDGPAPAPWDFRFAWERPKDRFALTAAGAAWRFMAEGERRFQELSERVGTALRQAVTEGGDGTGIATPLALGGFAFFERLDDAQWPGFGAAQMVIPRWMVVRARGHGHAVLSATVGPRDDPAATAADLARLGEGWTNGKGAASSVRSLAPARPTRGPRRADDVEGHRRWLDMVRRALARIRAGTLSKVVLARAVELFGAMPGPLRVFRALRAAYPDCFTFLIDPGCGHGFLGATPERLARLERGMLRLGAMAGSAPRGERPEVDALNGQRLLHSEKERSEHAIVVEAILEAVRHLGGVVEWPKTPRLVRLTNVQHLYTPITVRTPEPVPLLSLLGRLHPTPAVGGHPRPEALALIRGEEDFDRGWYAGPVGWIDARGHGEFAVALRSGTLAADRARLFTGAGIVADSDPEMEYFETQLKLQPMLDALVHD
jgi:isochorismate synthase